MFLICGLRPGELFALRVDDVEGSQIRIDETMHEGKARDRTKTEASAGWVILPPELAHETDAWIDQRGIRAYPRELLFVTARGHAIHSQHYLKRDLACISKRAGLAGVTHQILRRTTATHMQKHGTIKDTQGHLRHTDPETTLRFYQKVIPESLAEAVRSWDRELAGLEGPTQ